MVSRSLSLAEGRYIGSGTVRNVYRTCEGFASKSSLLPEQLFVMQMDEFMKRRYDFRFNQLTSQVECRERNSFNFYFHPVDKRLMASIAMNAHYEGLKLWDKDVVRYLNSDHVPVYQPIENSFMTFLIGMVRIILAILPNEFLVIILIGRNCFVVGFLV